MSGENLWHKLKRKEEAPEKGRALIYTRMEDVIWQRYNNIEEVEKWIDGKEVLEIHLFDNEKEYRALIAKSKRFPDGFLENCFNYSGEPDENIYKEEICLEDGGTIEVINHLKYDENSGMATVDGYQLLDAGFVYTLSLIHI